MIFHDVDQNSENWNGLRLGKFTASSFSDLFMDKKTQGYQKAIIKVAYEIVTGESEEIYSNKWMQRGHEKEPIAVANYERFSFNDSLAGGFFEYNEFVGASPDRRLVNENGGCEFKCPSHQVYHEYLKKQALPSIYYWQVHGQILCTGWDFVDFMPYSSPKLKQILIRVYRDEKILDQLKWKLDECIIEVKEMINLIKN